MKEWPEEMEGSWACLLGGQRSQRRRERCETMKRVAKAEEKKLGLPVGERMCDFGHKNAQWRWESKPGFKFRRHLLKKKKKIILAIIQNVTYMATVLVDITMWSVFIVVVIEFSLILFFQGFMYIHNASRW